MLSDVIHHFHLESEHAFKFHMSSRLMINESLMARETTPKSFGHDFLDQNDTTYEDYIFDRIEVRAIFITLYSVVFCCCFFGNLLVILVVTLSRRLRSITNFFLANLAVADLCVGVFCVYQNLSIYLIPSWVFGDFLCKMYQFVHSLSYTASIFILMVICMERYFAIIHPITCKQILTSKRLRLVILAVWVTSALYSAPKFIFIETITVNITNGPPETICIPQRKKFNSELFDMINFGFLYVLPLMVMTVLYTRIAVGLWRSSRTLERHLNAAESNGVAYSRPQVFRRQNYGNMNADKTNFVMSNIKPSSVSAPNASNAAYTWKARAPTTTSSQNVLRARRGVIRMLIVVVLTFAVCNLPFHARKMWQYWSDDYRGSSNFSTLFTPITFLLTYFNSGINPLLYAFLSRNFRKGMRELILCSIRGAKKSKAKQRLLEGRNSTNRPISQSSMLRRGSIRSTKCNTSVTVVNVVGDNSDLYVAGSSTDCYSSQN